MKNWNDLSNDYYKFLLEQGEKKLDATIETKKQHRVKAFILFSIITSALSSSIHLLINKNVDTRYELASYIIIVLCLISFWYLHKALFLYSVSTKGTPPSVYKDLSVYNEQFDSELIFKSVLYSEIENVTSRIELNNNENLKLIPYLEKASYSLVVIIPFLVLYFLSLF